MDPYRVLGFFKGLGLSVPLQVWVGLGFVRFGVRVEGSSFGFRVAMVLGLGFQHCLILSPKPESLRSKR